MIENGIPPQSILLLTFTNKAANEMSERAAQILDERCNKITACTYHSFCAKMLRIYGVLVGLRKNFTILSESDVVNKIKLLIAENPEKYKIKSTQVNSCVPFCIQIVTVQPRPFISCP